MLEEGGTAIVFPTGLLETQLLNLKLSMRVTACKALQAFAEYLKAVATGLERDSGIACPDFQSDPDRYAQFTNAMNALTARVTVLQKQYQRGAREEAVENQERSREQGKLSSHPDRVFKIIKFLREAGEKTLKEIATAPLESLLRDQTPVKLRNVVWGYGSAIGALGHRGCEIRYLKLSEWQNRYIHCAK